MKTPNRRLKNKEIIKEREVFREWPRRSDRIKQKIGKFHPATQEEEGDKYPRRYFSKGQF